ncbi:MAG: ATP-binding cassette domain-containing protein [Candidatus Wallbacteria bacterium]|nr:ATP-binding cassette domain-containing protein [Candidatus Wallbacteria bacterium]
MIRIENLSRSFGKFSLKRINFELQSGEFLLLSGHNGAGKTLLLETIAGFWKPDEGRICINGRDMLDQQPEMRGIGFVYQDLWLFPHLSARENICYGLRIQHKGKREIDEKIAFLDNLIELRDLLSRTNVALLSGGERQKLALARTLAVDPEILFFDEPTHMLDNDSVAVLNRIVAHLKREQHKTIIYISHRDDKIRELADRTITLKDGEMVS